jgi:hypothetical protein
MKFLVVVMPVCALLTFRVTLMFGVADHVVERRTVVVHSIVACRRLSTCM